MNKTPSSQDYVILSGSQIVERALELVVAFHSLETKWTEGAGYYLCNTMKYVMEQMFKENGYAVTVHNDYPAFKKMQDLLYEFFRDDAYGQNRSAGLWHYEDLESRFIGALLFNEYCKEKQVKFYIKKAGLTAIPVNGTFAKAAQWVNNFEGFENTNAFSCFAINRTLGLNLNERPDELYFYERMFDCRIWTFNSKLSDPFGKRASYGEVNELRVLALCLAQAVWDSGDRLEPETT